MFLFQAYSFPPCTVCHHKWSGVMKDSHKKLAATSAGALCFNVIHLVLLVTSSVFRRNLSELCVFSFRNSRVNLISIWKSQVKCDSVSVLFAPMDWWVSKNDVLLETSAIFSNLLEEKKNQFREKRPNIYLLEITVSIPLIVSARNK